MRDPTSVALIVHACAYLHNMAIDVGLVPITRESQRDPDMEPLITRNALTYLLNAVKRNRDRRFHTNYRRQPESEYIKGVLKRDQILREQFGERGIKLGRVEKKGRGRPLGGGQVRTAAQREAAAARRRAAAEGRQRPRGRPRNN